MSAPNTVMSGFLAINFIVTVISLHYIRPLANYYRCYFRRSLTVALWSHLNKMRQPTCHSESVDRSKNCIKCIPIYILRHKGNFYYYYLYVHFVPWRQLLFKFIRIYILCHEDNCYINQFVFIFCTTRPIITICICIVLRDDELNVLLFIIICWIWHEGLFYLSLL